MSDVCFGDRVNHKTLFNKLIFLTKALYGYLPTDSLGVQN